VHEQIGRVLERYRELHRSGRTLAELEAARSLSHSSAAHQSALQQQQLQNAMSQDELDHMMRMSTNLDVMTLNALFLASRGLIALLLSLGHAVRDLIQVEALEARSLTDVDRNLDVIG